MAKSKNPEDEVQGIDPTPVYIGGETFADRIVPHLKKILGVIGIVVVIVGAYLLYGVWRDRKATQQTTALLAAIDVATKPVEPPAVVPGDAGVAEPPPEGTYATEAERAEAALARLRKVEGDPRDAAKLLEADLLFDAGDLDGAERAYGAIANRRGVEGAVAREGLGFVAEARAQALEGDAKTAALEQALAAFRAVQPDEEGPRREHALYHEARILAQLGKKDEAKAAFEKALAAAQEAGSDIASLIELRLVQLETPAS